MSKTCRVCCSPIRSWFVDPSVGWEYERCIDCGLIQREAHLSVSQEHERYRLHENGADQLGYQTYLRPLWQQIQSDVPKGARGLDFGCGPVPVLSDRLRTDGYVMANFDLFFQPDRSVLSAGYDFIVMSEVIEHLAAPLEVLRGLPTYRDLFIMTQVFDGDRAEFARWAYRRDSTHITLFTVGSLRRLAAVLGLEFATTPSRRVFRLSHDPSSR